MANSTDITLRVRNEYLAKELDEAKGKLEDFKQSATKQFEFVKLAAISALAGMAIKKGFSMFEGMVAEATEAATSFAVLESVVKSTGGQSLLTADDMAALAEQMEKTTNFTGEMVQDAEAVIATFSNIKGDNFVATTKVAADMATVLKTDLTSSATLVSKALQDLDTKKLSRAGVTFTTQQEAEIQSLKEMGKAAEAQRIILNQLEHDYGGAAEAAAKAGFQPLITQLGNIGEEIGTSLLPMLHAIGEGAAVAATWVTETVIPAFDETMSGVMIILEESKGSIFNVLELVAVGFAGGMAFLQTVWSNGFDMMKVVGLTYVTTVLDLFGNIVHFLTDTVPTSVKYFADNWRNIFTDAYNFSTTVFGNMITNIQEFVAGMKRLLQGGSANFKFVALTEGFESTLMDLPKYTKRIPSELEAQLNKELEEAAGAVSTSFEDNLASNMEGIEAAFTVKPKDKTPESEKTFGDGEASSYVIDNSEEEAKQDAKDKKKLEKVKALSEKIAAEKERQAEKKKDEEEKGKEVISESVESSYNRIRLAAASVKTEDDKDAKKLAAMEKELVALESNTEALEELAKTQKGIDPKLKVSGSLTSVRNTLEGQSSLVAGEGQSTSTVFESILTETRNVVANTSTFGPALDLLAKALPKTKGGLA